MNNLAEGRFSPNYWLYALIIVAIIVIVINALFLTVDQALTDWAGNETVFAPIIQTLFWILVGAGLLLVIVNVFLPGKRGM